MEPPASTGAAAAAAAPAPASSDDNNDGRRTLYLAGVGEAVGTDMEVGAQCVYMNYVHESPIDRSRQYRSDRIGTFSTEQELRRVLEAFGPLDDDYHDDTNHAAAIQAFAGKVRTRSSLRPSHVCVHL